VVSLKTGANSEFCSQVKILRKRPHASAPRTQRRIPGSLESLNPETCCKQFKFWTANGRESTRRINWRALAIIRGCATWSEAAPRWEYSPGSQLSVSTRHRVWTQCARITGRRRFRKIVTQSFHSQFQRGAGSRSSRSRRIKLRHFEQRHGLRARTLLVGPKKLSGF
jgi:hypothetical protein